MNAPAPAPLAATRPASTAAAQAGLAALARAAATSANRIARAVLLAQARTLRPDQRDAQLITVRAEWPLLISRMAELEGLAPNAAAAGGLADAELMDIVEAVRSATTTADPSLAELAVLLLDVGDALDFAGRPDARRQDVRWAVEDAFISWPKACRRMAALTA